MPAGAALAQAPLASAPSPLRAADVRTGPQAPGFPGSTDGLAPGGTPAAATSVTSSITSTTGRLPQAADGGYTVDVASREAVRLFYKTVFASSTGVASGWAGDVAGCNAGDTSAQFKAAALRRINWHRAMAGVPAAVQLDASFSQKAQQAALLMAANNQLNHFPPASWTCYNAIGAEAAGKSNLGLGSQGAEFPGGAAAISNGYMRDPGSNNAAAGHRRWILYPQTQFMGVGDVQGSVKANAVWVQDANVFAARPAVRDDFVAWPPRGYVPYATVYPRWSLSYPQANFSAATVTMTENGTPIATRLEAVVNGFGENTLVWLPGSYTDGMNWVRPAADTVYTVQVSNVLVGGQARSFSYTTTVFDPDAAVSNGALAVSGSTAPPAGAAAAYTVGAWAGASSYQWRAISSTAYALSDGAEAGDTSIQPAISAGYSAVAAGISASGANSFHLAHTQPVDQVLQLRGTLVGRAESSLSFASRLGLATTAQQALVEVSVDEGASWQVLYQQAGGTAEPGFTSRSVSLAALAGKTFLLRFRYASTGLYYPQATTGVGWYIDDVRLSGVDAVASVAGPFDATPHAGGAAFSYTSAATDSGDRLLQARALMYGYAANWGPALRVTLAPAAAGLPSAAQSDCLFSWAERNYPQLFAPAATSQTSAPYYYRFYSGTQAYLGTASTDGNVYYLKGGRLENVGPASGWLVTAGCR